MAKNSPGDFTGNRKAKLAKEAQLQQAEAARTVSMVTAAEEKAKNAEVVDYTKEKPAPVKDTGPVDLTVTNADDDDETIAKIVASTDDESPAAGTVGEATDLTAEKPQIPVEPVRVEKQKVLIRSKYDLSQVTVGKGTFYDFEEGRQYYVPPNVARHLNERDYVDVLS